MNVRVRAKCARNKCLRAKFRPQRESSEDRTAKTTAFSRARSMSVHPFAGLDPKPSAWGFNWMAPPQHQVVPVAVETPRHSSPLPEPTCPGEQFAHLPVALLSTLKREKKPFTYTPGGVNLSEVLNARLQKRLERRKKYSDEHTPNNKQLVVATTYNTPLHMYSMQNAMEALEVQAELAAADKSPSAASPVRSSTLPRNHTVRFQEQDMDPGHRGVAQSKAFRVLQIITDTEEDSEEKNLEAHRDEMRFRGLRDSNAIPSKYFQTLQKITGTEDDEGRARGQQAVEALRPQSYPQQQRPLASYAGDQRTVLKRPAAFLPIKTSPGFRPGIHPPCLPTASHQRNSGTDF